MRRSDLKKLQHLQSAIDGLEMVMQDIRTGIIQAQSYEDKGIRASGNTDSPVEQTVLKLEQTEKKLFNRRNEYLKLKADIADYISGIEDPLLSEILILRFMYGFSWTKTAETMNTSEYSIKKIFERGVPK